MSKKKIFLYSLLSLLAIGCLYLYIWEKPKLEKLVENYVESLSDDQSIPFKIEIGKTNFSIIPLQLEIYDSELTPKKDLYKTLKGFKIQKVALRPSLIDLLVGKFWISLLSIQDSDIEVTLNKIKDTGSKKSSFEIDFDGILKRIPLSQLNIQDIRLKLN